MIVWRTGYTKAELKVCQAWNEENANECLGIADSLEICNANLGVNLLAMTEAVERQVENTRASLNNQKQLEENINEIFKNYEMGDDCLYPDDIANIMFTAQDLQDKTSEHGDNRSNQD